jgi:hypothetical protein
MSTETQPKVTAQAADPPAGNPQEIPPTGVITNFQQIADQLMLDVDRITAAIPKLEAGSHISTVKFVRGHLNIPNAFFASAISAVEQIEALSRTGLFDSATGRETLQYVEAFKPLLVKLAALYDQLAYTLQSLKATLAADALRIYGLSKEIGLKPGNLATASVAASMKQDLGRKGGRKPKDKSPAPPATPTTPTTGGAS